MAFPLARLHASMRRDEPLTTDAVTGEARLPIALYEVDDHRGDTDLVLSRPEAQRLLEQLAAALLPAHNRRGLEAVR